MLIKNLLPKKDILKTFPFNDIKSYVANIKILTNN